MTFYDLIHAYQPYDPKRLKPDWVYTNLNEIFVPTSNSLKEGRVKRSVNIKGWTLDNWFIDKETFLLADKVVSNLNIGSSKNYLDIGFSAYSHAILPLLSNNVIEAQIKLDHKVVLKHFGKPSWFWPPEGAIDKNTMVILHNFYPEVVIVIPDLAINKINFSGIARIKHKSGYQKVIIMNTLLKDIFMNAHLYVSLPDYISDKSDLIRDSDITNISKDASVLGSILHGINPSLNVLMRDWENAGSVLGLKDISKDGSQDVHLEHKAILDLN